MQTKVFIFSEPIVDRNQIVSNTMDLSDEFTLVPTQFLSLPSL